MKFPRAALLGLLASASLSDAAFRRSAFGFFSRPSSSSSSMVSLRGIVAPEPRERGAAPSRDRAGAFDDDINPRHRATEEEREEGGEEEKERRHRRYRLLTNEEISTRLRSLAERYPSLCTLTSAQEAFGLPTASFTAGGATVESCPYDHPRHDNHDNIFANHTPAADPTATAAAGGGGGCKNWILTIEDSVAHPPGSTSWGELPEVFLSGALHGNERVGPTAVLEAAELILEAASCEALPRARGRNGGGEGDGGDGGGDGDGKNAGGNAGDFGDGNANADVSYARSSSPVFSPSDDEELRLARLCRSDLSRQGISPSYRQWLARLATTRRIVIVPATNALEYEMNVKREHDPNRDFPYHQTDPTKCMRTIAGRTINELFRNHMFQLSLTFHGVWRLWRELSFCQCLCDTGQELAEGKYRHHLTNF
uniref:Peptidase M14 carboxypeptidase A domain-containing protein n=1 Tax=Odontella aurita TaxID=265563 RepID=A0A7S4N9P9_9STRA|mmetsp:Transcript_54740/g.163658  ORF Transcript_54740/g.163658 Transcript_54740/m.163658 type:complete len:426 (+) Transcript_54740:288-1565(+)